MKLNLAFRAAAGTLPKPFSAGVIHTRLQELLPDGEKPEPLKRKAVG